jgi:hypothetical protein
MTGLGQSLGCGSCWRFRGAHHEGPSLPPFLISGSYRSLLNLLSLADPPEFAAQQGWGGMEAGAAPSPGLEGLSSMGL